MGIGSDFVSSRGEGRDCILAAHTSTRYHKTGRGGHSIIYEIEGIIARGGEVVLPYTR